MALKMANMEGNEATILTLRPFGPNRPKDGFLSMVAVDTVEVPIQDHVLSLEEAQNLISDDHGNKMVERVQLFELADGSTVDLLLNEEGKMVGLDTSLFLLRGKKVVDEVVGRVAFVRATPDGDWRPLSASDLGEVHQRLVTALAEVKVGEGMDMLFIPAIELEV